MTLVVENLFAAYGEIEVLHGVNLAVEKGQIIALLGANGAGKSTTIKAIMGLVKPSAGRILLDGRDLSGHAAHIVARAGIALVPEGRKIFKKMTVEENLQVGGVVRSGAEVREQLADVYALFPRLGERRSSSRVCTRRSTGSAARWASAASWSSRTLQSHLPLRPALTC